MNRREFASLLGCAVVGAATGRAAPAAAPRVAITLDDFRWDFIPLLGPERCNRALLEALDAHSVKAALFVRGGYVDNERGRELLSTWDREGHTIANHSYSHLYYPSKRVDFAQFSEDMLRCERVLSGFPRFRKLFRFPYLKEGDTAEKRDAMRAFLATHGYRNGHVTIDASDWYVDQRLRARLAREPSADLAPYRAFYLDHVWERALFYDDLSRKVLGRSVPHTLLLHHNLVNGLFLGDLLRMFRSKGWKLADASEPFADPVFVREPDVLPAGESLVWALAKESGKYDSLLRYPAEDGEYEKPKMDALGL